MSGTGGNARHLDDITHRALTDYLSERRRRWPNTSNPHLLLTERTAHDHRPVSHYWLRSHIRELDLTLNQLRIDRQLEEALVHVTGPAPPRRDFRHRREHRHPLRPSSRAAARNSDRGRSAAVLVIGGPMHQRRRTPSHSRDGQTNCVWSRQADCESSCSRSWTRVHPVSADQNTARFQRPTIPAHTAVIPYWSTCGSRSGNWSV
jgi:hypothetical protein